MMRLLSLTRTLPVVLLLALTLPALPRGAGAQPGNRIRFNNQDLFLSGGNIAWVDFARDVGPGTTQLNRFEEVFRDVRDNGGNALRFWLHTSGASTPEFTGMTVSGPGAGTIDDLRAILDLAEQYEVGLIVTLWSFDMLRISEGAGVTDRNYALLTDTTKVRAYIDNALLPMVAAFKDHPALIAWEVFNEPEGMSAEHGWSGIRRVPMSAVQRFVNRVAGAIHRADPDARVTNGSWSFIALTDAAASKNLESHTASELAAVQLETIRKSLSRKYRYEFSLQEAAQMYDAMQPAAANFNYYTDARLVAAGGDPLGTLDFYTVHYYNWAGTTLSPFHRDYSYWGLTKPLVVAEFYVIDTFGIPNDQLYTTLYNRGYAGALGWQWFDYAFNRTNEHPESWPNALANMRRLAALHSEAVDLHYRNVRIASFHASPTEIEIGDSTTVTWEVKGGRGGVTLNGAPVDSVGSRTFTLDATTTFTLVARGADTTQATRQVTVQVLPADQINRAKFRTAYTSSNEVGHGNTDPARAVDGNAATRWASEWKDDQWYYVDLGKAFDVARVVLNWEAAFGRTYDLDVSNDGIRWTTVHQERAGNGSLDEIVFTMPVSARYVRMHGLTRATQWGFSLYEFEVYGVTSAKQPPTVALTHPRNGGLAGAGADVVLAAAATDSDGTIAQVLFVADGDTVATVTAAPFAFTWPGVTAGIHDVYAIATDNDGITVTSPTVRFEAVTSVPTTRYEAELARFDGDVTVQSLTTGPSGGSFLSMRDSGTITWDHVAMPFDGDFPITIGYMLPFSEKGQYLEVNGVRIGEVMFEGPINRWLKKQITVPLKAGDNQIVLSKSWGWMYFDYLEVGGSAVDAEDEALPQAFSLGANYPNPFNPSTVIPFTLGAAEHVRVDVFDLTGRRVATLVDELRPAGSHQVRFDARNLASGVYLYQIRTGAHLEVRAMVLAK